MEDEFTLIYTTSAYFDCCLRIRLPFVVN